MSNLIYVETSVPGSFHETRQTEREQTRRRWTREWWDVAPHDLLVTSEAVLDELRRAPDPKRTRCLMLLDPLRNLAPSTRTDTLVEAYLTHRPHAARRKGGRASSRTGHVLSLRIHRDVELPASCQSQ
jgi:hypothetical protein